MSNVSSWSNSAGGNTSASPDGAPEGMAPSGVNDTIREIMAGSRRQFEDAQWMDFGHTVSRNSATVFKAATDVTAIYGANRRVKCYDGTTLYGTVVSSSFTVDTTITVTLDSGALTASLSKVAVSILSSSQDALPRNIGELNANLARLSATGTQTFSTALIISGNMAQTGTNTHAGAETFTGGVIFTSNEPLDCNDSTAGTGAGPQIDLRRTANRANSDYLGFVRLQGYNASGIDREWAGILGQVIDAANATEDAILILRTIIAGASASRLYIGAGVYNQNAVGGDKGVNTFNIYDLWINGSHHHPMEGTSFTNPTIVSNTNYENTSDFVQVFYVFVNAVSENCTAYMALTSPANITVGYFSDDASGAEGNCMTIIVHPHQFYRFVFTAGVTFQRVW